MGEFMVDDAVDEVSEEGMESRRSLFVEVFDRLSHFDEGYDRFGD
jgi:hypothetical protein